MSNFTTFSSEQNVKSWLADPPHDPEAWVASHVNLYSQSDALHHAMTALSFNASSMLFALKPYLSSNSVSHVLHTAQRLKNTEAFEALCGPDTKIDDQAKENIFTTAILMAGSAEHQADETAVVKWMMSSAHAPLWKQQFQSQDRFPQICARGNLPLVRTVFPWRQSKDMDGEALDRATRNNHPDVVRFLLDNDAVSPIPRNLLRSAMLKSNSLPLITHWWPLADAVQVVVSNTDTKEKIRMVNAAESLWSIAQLDQVLMSQPTISPWFKECPILIARQQHHTITKELGSPPHALSRLPPKM